MVGYCITGLFGKLPACFYRLVLTNAYLAAKYGGGYNQWDITPEDLQGFFKVYLSMSRLIPPLT